MFDQHAKETLQAAHQGAVHHVRAVLLAVFADIGQVKPFGQVEVKLNGRELPLAPNGILDFQVDLRAVESAAASSTS